MAETNFDSNESDMENRPLKSFPRFLKKPRSKFKEAIQNMVKTISLEAETRSESQNPDQHKAISLAEATQSESTDKRPKKRPRKLSPETKRRIREMLTPKEFPPDVLKKRKDYYAKLRNPMTLRSGRRVAACQVCLGNETTRGRRKWCKSCIQITFYAGRKVMDDPFCPRPMVAISKQGICERREQAKLHRRAAEHAARDRIRESCSYRSKKLHNCQYCTQCNAINKIRVAWSLLFS